MATTALSCIWFGVLVVGPVAGLVLGPWARRTLSRRLVLSTGAAAFLVAAMAFTPVSLAGVLADHFVLAVAYMWLWLWLGMIQSRVLRAGFFSVPTLVVLWGVSQPLVFFFVWSVSDLMALPDKSISINCGLCTRVIRMRPYGWVAHSGYELSVHNRLWGIPLEFEWDKRRFDDSSYWDVEQYSACVVGNGDCTIVVAYSGQEVWRVRL